MQNKPSEELLERATDLLVERQDVSVSLLQRHLKLGYQNTLYLLAALEERGAVQRHSDGTWTPSAITGPK